MKRQTRPFIVEIKQKRGNARQSRSIWGDLDLSAIAAGARKEAESIKQPNRQLIDSDVSPIDAEDKNKPRAEHLMADPEDAEAAQATIEAPVKVEVKKRTPRPKKATSEPKRSVAKNVAKATVSDAVSAKAPRKVHSVRERTQKLDQIEKLITGGGSIKSATRHAGISEQTYYQWKKAAAASESGELKDLLALEEENTRLKKLLADRLREENAELKKKLGLK